jgi:hypothetical protein
MSYMSELDAKTRQEYLSDVSTKELVDELAKREGVCEYKIPSRAMTLPDPVVGPARILVICLIRRGKEYCPGKWPWSCVKCPEYLKKRCEEKASHMAVIS